MRSGGPFWTVLDPKIGVGHRIRGPPPRPEGVPGCGLGPRFGTQNGSRDLARPKIGLGGRNLVKKIDLFFGIFFFTPPKIIPVECFLVWNVSPSLRSVSSRSYETFFTKMFPLFTSFRSSKIFFVPQIFFSPSLRSEKFFLSWRKKFVYHGVMNKVFLSIERFKFRTKNQTSLGRCLFAE